jgi:ribosomal protein S27AE
LYETALDHLWRSEREQALDALHDALDVQPDFTDAHLLIAENVTDPAVKRHHLELLLAHDPGSAEGIRQLMLLDGRLTPEEAERSRSSGAPLLRRAETVKVTTRTQECPVCGGALTLDDDNRRVLCRFCGHTAPLPAPADDGSQTIGVAQIQRAARGVVWEIGGHIQHCNNCGAERTIPSGRMSGVCTFCGSTTVIVADATGTLEQPDTLLPFICDAARAKDAIRERLRSMDERVYALHGGNKIAEAQIEGVYLPFWVYDAVLDVTRRVTITNPGRTANAGPVTLMDDASRFQDGVIGIAIPAVTTPPASVINSIQPFTVADAIPYDPRLLTRYPAALYTIDFEQAALTARTRAATAIRNSYSTDEKSQHKHVSISAFVQQMTFRLMLFPVWIAMLTERDGDRRVALVNGQTGRAAIGAPQPPSKG